MDKNAANCMICPTFDIDLFLNFCSFYAVLKNCAHGFKLNNVLWVLSDSRKFARACIQV